MEIFKQSDQTLINKALQGNANAWKKLVMRHEKHIFNMCYRLMLNREDALDLTQEVFLSIYRNLPNYRGEGNFSSWMLRIANNRCIDHLRKKKLIDDIDAHQDLACFQPSPEQNAALHSQNKLVMKFLASLPAEQRHIIELKFFQQKTFEEIETLTGVSTNTIKTRFYAALKQLKKHKELRYAL